MAMKGRIKGFATCVPFNLPSTQSFIREMTLHWADTLQTLIVSLPMYITSGDIHTILTRCTKLKKFDCLVGRIINPSVHNWETVPGPEMLYSIENGAGHGGGNWTCVGLEEFRMMFTDGRKVNAMDPILSLQEGWTVRAINSVYQQIGRLTNLKDLAIGWWTTEDFAKCSNLDMSFQSGLVHMAGLKSLKTLDITYVRHVNIGMAEMQWMVETWP
ncbi:hypothetical protein BGZ65_005656, partial [Modicella reniformis]